MDGSAALECLSAPQWCCCRGRSNSMCAAVQAKPHEEASKSSIDLPSVTPPQSISPEKCWPLGFHVRHYEKSPLLPTANASFVICARLHCDSEKPHCFFV
jgi:hypothetical protein